MRRRLTGLLDVPVSRNVISGRPTFVTMMQSANFGKRGDVALLRWPHRSKLQSIFIQPQVRAPAMIIGQVTLKDTVQVSSVRHDHMVQAFTPERTDEAFQVGRLPGRAGRNPELLQPQNLGAVLEGQTINAVPVWEQVLGWCGRVGLELDLAAGKAAARLTGLAILASLRQVLGSLNRVDQVVGGENLIRF